MSDPAPIKFLLVDDLDDNLVALEGLLKRDGLELLKAKSGKEALEILLAHEISLAFIDIQMPVMSGFELAEIMCSTERTRSTPIIFLTAGTIDHERWSRGFEAGAIDFLPKPIDPMILLNKAAVFFELAGQRQRLQEKERILRELNDKLEWSNSELERASRNKDQFIAMLAHELRNPLAPILTGMEVLRKNPGDTLLNERVADMLTRQVGQIAHLIDDLMDVSRMTTGKIQLKKQSVRMSEVIEQSVESVQPLIEESGHNLILQNDAPDFSLLADPFRLIQVISNLISNAVKHTPQGGEIIVSVKDTGKQVILSVQDNGNGIPPGEQEKIFEMFEQGASGSREGLGIGLTLVRSLVEMHGGSITLNSDGMGKGSEFVVTLPSTGEEEAPEKTEQPAPFAAPASFRVLVADDGKATADVLGMFFDLEGIECQVVYDGGQAVEAARSNPPQLACFDLGMPVTDGYEAARQVRKMHPDVYLVALSGWGSDDDKRKTAEAGFDEHLVKPVKPEILRELLARVQQKLFSSDASRSGS